MSKKSCLLPDSVVPSHYELELTPDLKNFTFQGYVAISVDVRKPTKTIVLHGADLEIIRCIFSGADHRDDRPSSVSIDKETETITLSFEDELSVGKGTVVIRYAGTLNDKMAGFYRSAYTVNGETRYLATTQFEATDARRAFPCWDEPARKATFSVTFHVSDDKFVLSNMPVKDVQVSGRLKAIHFER
ncbi:MAG: M1 family peptidase, partial [bacterium]|nr:M1 family peptidase [bacterium]